MANKPYEGEDLRLLMEAVGSMLMYPWKVTGGLEARAEASVERVIAVMDKINPSWRSNVPRRLLEGIRSTTSKEQHKS